MAYSSVNILCLLMLWLGRVADACDTQGMTQCQTDYFAAVPGATGTQVCDAVGTLASCMNSKGSGCPSAALAQFNTVVDQAKAPLCTATGTCSNHTLCTGSSLENTSTSSARSMSMFWLLVALVGSLFFFGDACDTQGLTQCQTDYFAAAPGATGTQVCDAVGTLASCMNSKGAGCPSAALAQFNTVVDQAKAPLCTATGTCSNTTLCTGASNTGPESSTSFAWAAPLSLLAMSCIYLGVMW